jgi:hypothetical protein
LALLLIPTPVRGETPASFARRLEGRLGARHGTYLGKASSELRRLGITDATTAREYDQLADLLRERCGLEDDHFEPGLWDMTRAWFSCPKCGPVVELDARRAHWVCQRHNLWTGPAIIDSHDRLDPALAGSQHGTAVGAPVIKAAAGLEQHISIHPDLVNECLRRATSMGSRGRRQDLEPDDLPVALVLVSTVLNLSTLLGMAAAADTEAAYRSLQDRIEEVASEFCSAATELQLVELTDQAWLLLRPTVAAAREASGQDTPVDQANPVVPLPVGLAGLKFKAAPGEWLSQLRTARTDQSWWIDRFVARPAGFVTGSSAWTLLCPAGHCLHDSQHRARRHPNREFHCTVCAKSRAVLGISSLVDSHASLAAQWNQKRNGGLTAGEVLSGSNKRIWWLCRDGHSWQATVANRALLGSGCPFCAFKAVLPNHNDLATTHPALTKLWDPEVDQKQANEVSAGNSTAELHLRCAKGHRFVRTPAKLVLRPFCPKCDGRTVSSGENDLLTTHPKVASWWHPYRNGKLGPAAVKAGSEKRVWWLCPDGHDFEQAIAYRTRQENQPCPADTGHLMVTGENDLATKHPDLLVDWDFERNDVDPTQVVPGVKKRWWTCRLGHSQFTQVRNRMRAGGCSACLPEERAGTPASGFRRGRQGWETRIVRHVQEDEGTKDD